MRTEAGHGGIQDYYRVRDHAGLGIVLAALKTCSRRRDLKTGERIHADIEQDGSCLNIFVASSLVDMYAKCRSMSRARQVFDGMVQRDVVLYNCMVLGYAQNGQGSLALQMYARMVADGIAPTVSTYVAALKACTSLVGEGRSSMECLERGCEIHFQAVKGCHHLHNNVANTLLDMYSKCGSIEDAMQVFRRMQRPDVVSWTAIIMGYAERDPRLALALFYRMQEEGLSKPDAVIFVAALKACASLAEVEQGVSVDEKLVRVESLEQGRNIHMKVARLGHELHSFVATTLIDMYAKCGSMVDACRVFERMQQRSVVSWNCIILGYVQNGQEELALEMYTRMQDQGVAPTSATFVAVIKACASLGANGREDRGKDSGRRIHLQAARTGLDLDVFVGSSLVDMYSKCGSLGDAQGVFDRLPERDAVCWNCLIMGYAQSNQSEVAISLFTKMQEQGLDLSSVTFLAVLKASASLEDKEALKIIRDIHAQVEKQELDDKQVVNTLIDCYSKCGSLQNARCVFEKMKRPDVVSWNCIISGYVQNGNGQLSLQMYRRMVMHENSAEPDSGTFVAVLKACASLADLEAVEQVHIDVRKAGMERDALVASALIYCYGKCGSIDQAKAIFDRMEAKDLVAWDAMISGLSRRNPQSALRVFEELEEQQALHPDGLVFVSLLTACVHGGMVDKAKELFHSMIFKYGLEPSLEHYSCMVDILGQENELQAALALIQSMPFQPDAVIWTALLSACQRWGNADVGKVAFQALKDDASGAYVMVSNMILQ